MVVVVFRARMRAGLGPEIQREAVAKATRMLELAAAMPGFISYKEFASQDGEQVSIAEFDTQEHSVAWRDLPEHRAVQQWGREVLFSECQIQVCELVRVSSFRAEPA